MNTVIYYILKKQHFQYKYTFYNQDHINMLNFKLLLQLYHKET